jgi:CcmD family protein
VSVVGLPFAAPALPLHEAGKYVAGAYVVFIALILIYVAIMAARLGRIERELGELEKLAGRPREDAREKEPVA